MKWDGMMPARISAEEIATFGANYDDRIRADERERIVAVIRATMSDCSGQFIADYIERGDDLKGAGDAGK